MFVSDLGLSHLTYVIFCDSQSAIDLSKSPMYHSCTEHINVMYHCSRSTIEDQLLQLKKIHTNENVVDMLTKVVSKERLALCVKLAGMNKN